MPFLSILLDSKQKYFETYHRDKGSGSLKLLFGLSKQLNPLHFTYVDFVLFSFDIRHGWLKMKRSNQTSFTLQHQLTET